MKRLSVRLGGLVFISAVLAACSGLGQNVTPSTGSGPNALSPAASAPRAAAGARTRSIYEVTGAARAMAAQFHRIGQPRFLPPSFKHQAQPHVKNGYPLDMTCQTKACPVMNGSTAYNVYVTDGKTCTNGESCWGDPEEFLKGLAGSPLAGVATQYTGAAASAFKYGDSMTVKYSLAYSNTFYQNDLLTILAQAVTHFQKIGLNVQYHIFLSPGTDTCFDQTGACYSPDDLSSFAFCAYHDAVGYNGTPIVFSIEPYQNATVKVGNKTFYACQLQKAPKGTDRLSSSTASTLSHESFEAWSDPLPNSGWFNAPYGEEIGDVCAYQFMTNTTLGGKKYFIQTEYSNAVHGCADH